MKTQTQEIEQALKKGKKLTPLSALRDFGTLRLGARIWDLRSKGLDIKSEKIKTPSGKHVSIYWL